MSDSALVVPIDISASVTADAPDTAPPQSQAKAGFASSALTPARGGNIFSAQEFHVRQILAGNNHAALVLVKETKPGGVGPVGQVSVQPLVNQQDGYGNQVPHDTIYDICYFRLQGGVNAVVIDPAVGDIGLALFCDRDISNVVATKAASPPGSWRQNAWSDGLYLGGFLNGTPTNYIAFVGGGISLNTSGAFTVQASNVTIDNGGNVHTNGNIASDGNMNATGEVAAHATSAAVHLSTHIHPVGTGTTGNPVPGT